MEEVRKNKEEEVKNLELRREEDLKMFAAQHQVNILQLSFNLTTDLNLLVYLFFNYVTRT